MSPEPAQAMSPAVADDAAEPAAERRRQVIRGGLWSAASQVLPALGTAVLSVAAGRYLGSGPLGQQSLIAYVNAAASSVIVISLNTALLQLGGRLQGEGDDRRLRALTRWAIGAHLTSGLVVLAAMAISGEIVGANRAAWLIIGCVSLLDAAADGLAVRLILAEGWVPIGRLRLIFQFIGPPLGIAFLFTGFGIAGIFLGDGLAALGLLIAAAVRFRRLGSSSEHSRPAEENSLVAVPTMTPVPEDSNALQVWSPPAGAPRSANAARARTVLSRLRPPVDVARTYGLFALGAVVTQVVTKRVEFVVLAIFATDTAIGMYSVAFMAVSLLAMVPFGIAAAAMPMVAAAEGRGELGRATQHLRLALRLGTLVSVPMVALLAALGPAAVVLVYGPRYDAAAKLVPLASLGLLVAVVCGVCTQFWSGQGRLGIVLGTGAIAGLVDVGAAVSAVPFLGATGAVIGNLAGQLALAGGLIFVTVRHTGAIGWRLDGALRMVVASGCGAVAAALVRIAVDGVVSYGPEVRAAISLALGSVVGVVVVVLIARVVRIFDAEEADWLLPLLPGRLRPAVRRLTLVADEGHYA